MELWIRSQDRRYLIKTEYLYMAYDEKNKKAYIGDKMAGHIGTYKTKERALEVLDEIQNILKPRIITKFRNELKYNEDKELNTTYIPFNTFENTEIQELKTYVYEMPKE